MTARVDHIRRQVTVAADARRVWAALTDPGELSQWFGDLAEIDLRPGGRARFGWSESDAVVDAVIVEVDEPRRFAYRWAAGAGSVDDGPSTLVEFTIEVVEGGTLVTVVESGLASLPDEIYASTLAENTSGWESELGDLAVLLAVPASA